jgi:hypothetical protein
MRLNIPRISKTLGDFLTDNPSGAVNFSGMSLMFPRDSFEALGDVSLMSAIGSFKLAPSLLSGVTYKFVFDGTLMDIYIETEENGLDTKTTYIFADNSRVYDGIKPVVEDPDNPVAPNIPDQDILNIIDGGLYMDLNSFGTATLSEVTGKASIDRLYNVGLQNTYGTIVDFVNTEPTISILYGGNLSKEIYDQSEREAAKLGFFGISEEGETYRYGQCYIQIPPMLTGKVFKYQPIYFDKLDYSISPAFSYENANAIALYDIDADNYGLIQYVDYEGSSSGGSSVSGISGITSNGVRIMPNAQGIVELNGDNLYIGKDNKVKDTKKKNAS